MKIETVMEMEKIEPPGPETKEEAREKMYKVLGKTYDMTPLDRQEVSRLATIYHWDSVLALRELHGALHPKCNRYTNSPCQWSETLYIEDKCCKCGTQFPTWN